MTEVVTYPVVVARLTNWHTSAQRRRPQRFLHEAELAKGRILPTQGKNVNFVNTAILDKPYIVVAGHVDECTVIKIQKGEYIDFRKLIPRDKVHAQEDQWLELDLRGGRSFYVPVNETSRIGNYTKWEQAFRVYSNIDTRAFPHRSCELIEYNHILHTISQSFVWDNVYLYDKDFHIHMAHNPDHNWGIILQQAWSLRLRDGISSYFNSPEPNANGSNYNSPKENNGRVNEPCRCYNKGKCTAGSACRFEQRCSYCFKFGHAILTCRKLFTDQERNKRFRRDSKDGDQSS